MYAKLSEKVEDYLGKVGCPSRKLQLDIFDAARFFNDHDGGYAKLRVDLNQGNRAETRRVDLYALKWIEA